MSKKCKFRKVFFICKNNQVFNEPYEMVNCYRREDYAKTVCNQQRRLLEDETKKMYWDKQPVPTLKAEGFYLVPAALYEKILKHWAEEEQ